ncbi:MAG: hypothetical protein QOE72_2256 [Chloroflexota bacterium]|jgi:hypothetical protein|nr:hypothetical protein [Chloroflexota bacterium]
MGSPAAAGRLTQAVGMSTRTYDYVVPILHLRRVDGGDLFEMYAKSFSRIWAASYADHPEEGRTDERPA